MKHRFSVVHSRLWTATRQNLGQQMGNYPAGELTQSGVTSVFTQPACHTHQVTPIMINSERRVMASAQVVGEVAMNDSHVLCQPCASQPIRSARLSLMKAFFGHNRLAGITRPTACHASSYFCAPSGSIQK
jgi:hypothetical protein